MGAQSAQLNCQFLAAQRCWLSHHPVKMVFSSNTSFALTGVGKHFGPDDSEVAKCAGKHVDINWVDSVGMTALMWASHLGNVDVVRALLDRKADPMASDRFRSGARRRTALDYANGCGLAIDYAMDGESEEARSEGRQKCARILKEAMTLQRLMASMGA